MPGFLLTVSCQIQCGHGGKATPTLINPRVRLSGQPAIMGASPLVIAGCPNVVPAAIPTPAGPVPGPPALAPCVTANFIPATGTVRVKSMGMPLACQSSATPPAVIAGPIPVPPAVIIVAPPIPVPVMPVVSPGQMRVRAI